tara:strand:+ start:349 stop:510 length:162 start_codon:yes stop_codon:yes gene_type:complete
MLFAKKTCGAKTTSDGVNPVPIIQIEPPIAKSEPMVAIKKFTVSFPSNLGNSE